MTKPDPTQWIDIGEALKLATEGSVLDEFAAADLIEQGLSNGRVRARALIVRTSTPTGDARSLRLEEHSETGLTEHGEVAKSTWIGGRFSPDFFEQLQFRHPLDFCTPRGVVSFRGLQLHRRSFDKLMRDALSWDVSGVMKGRSRKEHAWLRFLFTIVELERDGELTEEAFPDHQSLLRRLVEELDIDDSEHATLDQRTIAPYVEGLWALMVRDNAKPE